MMKTTILTIFILGLTIYSSGQNNIEMLVKAYEAKGYHGTLLVAKGKKILYASSYGISDQATLRKNEIQTRYKTESIGKMFTATLIMQEVEKKTLELNDNLEKFFPGIYKNGSNITIHHLLSHTSGITETELNPNFKSVNKYSREEILQLRSEAPRAFNVPGQKFHYSNLGYTLLAEILEKTKGKSFDALIRQSIFNPSLMSQTGHVEDTLIYKNVAKPYVWLSTTKYMEETRMIGKRANASGGWISTVEDFYQFARNFISFKYINKETWKIMQTANHAGGNEFQPGYLYTYGLNSTKLSENNTLFGHTGGGGGYGCDLYFEPKSGYIVVNFMNMYGDSRLMTKNIFRLLLGEKLEPVTKWRDVIFGDLLVEKGLIDFQKNYKHYLSAYNILPTTPSGFNRIASAYDDINDQLTREIILKAGLAEFPEGGILWLNLGRCLKKQAKLQEAKETLQKGLEIAEKTKDDFLKNMINIEISRIS